MFFQKFERAERDKIRDEFDKNYPRLVTSPTLGRPSCVGSYLEAVCPFNADIELLTNYMDRWFVDFREVMGAGWLKRISSLHHERNPYTETDRSLMHRIRKFWGLAIPPFNANDLDELTAWKL